VKNIWKKVALFNLILLYCFVISFYNGGGYLQYSPFPEQQSHPQTASYQSSFSKILFCHTATSETSFSAVTCVPVSSFKNKFNDFGEFVCATEHVFRTSFLQYNFFSKKILLRLHPRILIFPFHYFW
jgi:hypothetical protein